jgi:hypothetical protein
MAGRAALAEGKALGFSTAPLRLLLPCSFANGLQVFHVKHSDAVFLL